MSNSDVCRRLKSIPALKGLMHVVIVIYIGVYDITDRSEEPVLIHNLLRESFMCTISNIRDLTSLEHWYVR